MSDRVRDAFEALIEQMEEPPTWEDLTAPDTVFIAPVRRRPDRLPKEVGWQLRSRRRWWDSSLWCRC